MAQQLEAATAGERTKKTPLIGRTPSARREDIAEKWWVIDANDLVVGRVATHIADLLRGKNKVNFTPHTNCGDFVVVINAEKVRFTGKKETDKFYYSHIDRKPGSLKAIAPVRMRQKRPEYILEHAVAGMLPKTKLGRDLLRKLKVYAGTEHPHAAQQPETYTVRA